MSLWDSDILDYIDVFTIDEIPTNPRFILTFRKNTQFLVKNIKILHRIGRGNFGEGKILWH